MQQLRGLTVVVIGGRSGIVITNFVLTGATYDIDGGQQLLSSRRGSR